MSIANSSILEALLGQLPHLRPQTYFKASLTALSHAMEDLVLSGPKDDRSLVIASFQRERFYRQESRRYQRIAEHTDQVYVLAAPETDFCSSSGPCETVAFDSQDALAQEWHLVVVGEGYACCLICAERTPAPAQPETAWNADDRVRRFEGIWTFDGNIARLASCLLLERIQFYRPELSEKLDRARATLPADGAIAGSAADPEPFAQRLVTYLQAGQYKLLKAYRSIATQERKERLTNSIVAAIRQSLDPDEVLAIAVRELGQALRTCRCVAYRCRDRQAAVTIEHEFAIAGVSRLQGKSWLLEGNPLLREAVRAGGAVSADDVAADPRLQDRPAASARRPAKGRAKAPACDLEPDPAAARALAERWQIASWLLVPVLYRDRLLGVVELHHCGALPRRWSPDEIQLVEAIAAQLGGASIQAQAYADLEDLNEQLEALERTRSNLIAITGHELRTPLSTIQVCLESLATEPDMPLELRQVMLNTALEDAERLRGLVQDFLTLSRLESGRVEWNLEPLPLQECVDLALSSVYAHAEPDRLPTISADVPDRLPPASADGEWLVELLSKLLDNACKFTAPSGKVTIRARSDDNGMLQVTVADTGRGIEPNRLEAVFDRFYQEEGSLRRTVGGTGLGLAICRQIARGLGGRIWAESDGKDCGSRFHVTIPAFQGDLREASGLARTGSSPRPSRKSLARRRSRASTP